MCYIHFADTDIYIDLYDSMFGLRCIASQEKGTKTAASLFRLRVAGVDILVINVAILLRK